MNADKIIKIVSAIAMIMEAFDDDVAPARKKTKKRSKKTKKKRVRKKVKKNKVKKKAKR